MKGTCKSLIQDLRFNGQCVCVCVLGGGGGGERERKSYQPGVYVPLKSQGTFSSFCLFCFFDDKQTSDTPETVVVLQNKTKITVVTIQI